MKILCGVVFLVLLLLWLTGRKKFSQPMKRMIFVLGAAALLGVLLGVNEAQNSLLRNGNRMKRNSAGKGNYQEEFEIYAEEFLKKRSYTIEIPEQRLTIDEAKRFLRDAEAEIEREFHGENASLNCIRNKVVIRDNYQGGKVRAEWSFDNYSVMDVQGNVVADELPEDGVPVGAQVVLTCGEQSCEYDFYFQVFPRILNEQELFFKELKQYLEEEKVKGGQEYLTLPEKVMGYSVFWAKKKEYLPEKILILGGILAATIPFLEYSKRREQYKKRELELALEYPDMINKLALLLGCGMTLSGAWKKIAMSYTEKQKDSVVNSLPVYEEMVITWHEMEDGIGEAGAYERFGERCGQPRYRKLSNLLTQNLKKGNRGILVLLETEVENAFEERKNTAKKYGEEAGTKLLIPMMIMLGIVMVILIVPAILSFQL